MLWLCKLLQGFRFVVLAFHLSRTFAFSSTCQLMTSVCVARRGLVIVVLCWFWLVLPLLVCWFVWFAGLRGLVCQFIPLVLRVLRFAPFTHGLMPFVLTFAFWTFHTRFARLRLRFTPGLRCVGSVYAYFVRFNGLQV